MSIQFQKVEKLKIIAQALCRSNRIKHILGVEKLIVKLADVYNLDKTSCRMMALGHDLFRDIDGRILLNMANSFNYTFNKLEAEKPVLLHGKLAALYLKRVFNINDEIFKAVFWHVSGHPDLSNSAKALLIADMAEENRTFPEASLIRKNAFDNLEKTYAAVIRLKMSWALKSNQFILPETVNTWNRLLLGGVLIGNYKNSQ
ncbi:MAG: bis(5'-nucleosyl)-tetraphosphatase (symmetrical) YqeK [Kosmotoga sp.]|uniref:bis(5'-nucleosyl)-tetraphosphatase (symmetrical) YqeK n=1 Tax=Kosmotoga sp. TaxID=1955248 RepID=UPI0025C517C4|nr:bis(5'-nucleosyl)-tetraphosphatase (symmetrical) YqeK [Kosmotoga sp.]MCD6159908.1 bis(5'-nucleosyl)-tetraphosphatase (symmetrical) YqeK [Kosmotoga sp.]